MNSDNGLLAKRIFQGDEEAFKILYEEFFHALLAIACKYVESEVAKDIVQDTFFKLWTTPHKFSATTDLRFYLYRSVQNQCLNYIRNKKVEDRYRDRVEVEPCVGCHVVAGLCAAGAPAVFDLPAVRLAGCFVDVHAGDAHCVVHLAGVVVVVTGTDANGVQIGEFGSSEGILEENIMWGRPGSPEKGEIFIKTEVIIKEGTNMERPGPLAAHAATDFITQEIREALKKADDSLVIGTETFEQVRRPGKKKVVIVKEIMGQGAMHDNLILPMEPVGVLGAKPNVDLGNVPVMVSPLEVLDGCIHALTCIGPASKEMSRHYWREPLVLEALHDEEVDLCGVIFVGSPQINSEKFYVSRRVGMMVEALDVDGAFVTTEGFGNNHIDFASHIEQIGMRGIPVVGMSFCAVQGALVVGNKYMTHMVDNNKSEAGIENEILACNTLCHEDAIRALAMLKTQMGGESVKAPEKKWNPNVKDTNIELISNVTGKPIKLVENETSLPMSQKRKEKYS